MTPKLSSPKTDTEALAQAHADLARLAVNMKEENGQLRAQIRKLEQDLTSKRQMLLDIARQIMEEM